MVSEPLRFLPKDKTVVLGLVTTKSRELERRDDLLRRIDEASKYVAVEQLAVSPQCGFFHGVDDDTMTIDEQWRKLQLVVDTAREVWARRPKGPGTVDFSGQRRLGAARARLRLVFGLLHQRGGVQSENRQPRRVRRCRGTPAGPAARFSARSAD